MGIARPSDHELTADRGFTMIEVMVAMFVLVIGILGVLSLLMGALKTTATNNSRVAATNLARELVEATRGLDYDDMTDALLKPALQAKGLGSGTPWTIQRRNTTYTVTATSCAYDSAIDNLAASPPDGVCTPGSAGVIGDLNGDDFRRTTFTLSWVQSTTGTTRTLTQTTMVVNPSGGLGPRITTVSPITQTITGSTNLARVDWTTTPAQTLRWSVDDGASGDTLTGTTSFATLWDLGTSGSGSEILDGAYQITGEPFDDRGISGEVKRANVSINRRQPYAPTGATGGHNTRIGDWVELEWRLNRERDILGYRAYWAGPDGVAGNGNDEQVCPAPAAGDLLDPKTTSCVDLAGHSGATRYYVVAVDRDSSNALRSGDPAMVAIAAASPRPASPTGLTVTTAAGLPKLDWTAPATGGVSFYRIYRDGVRYDRTSATETTFTDNSSGGTAHDYFITAVDSTFNESDAVGPVSWTP